MTYKTDQEISAAITLEDISHIAKKIGLTEKDLSLYGNNKAKVLSLPNEQSGKLILVTAINPTPAGEGKTTTSIGLLDGLVRLGKKAVATLREPSLGPVFGLKGGATGGGKAQIAPAESINLHFTGDLHAITSANNLIAAMIDNHIYWENELEIEEVTWKRCIDMNDRSLRSLELTIKKEFTRQEQFQITAASEIMAIFALAKDFSDLRTRIDKIIFGFNKQKQPLFVRQLGITDAVLVLLQEAFAPNLVQTIEHNPVFVHGGPFANVAHGCSSIVATKLALSLSDFVITEAGFGADLGAEKFINIKCREAGIVPAATVLVATIQALKMHGGAKLETLTKPDLIALKQGLVLLKKHCDILANFNLKTIVAINVFTTDSFEEKELISNWAVENNQAFSFSESWEKGGEGSQNLAKKVIETLEERPLHFTYQITESIEQKVNQIAKQIYGAENVEFLGDARKKLDFIAQNKINCKYVCVAKTPASLSDNEKMLGVPKGWSLKVKDITISNGADLVVIHCGKILTLPGLPKKTNAMNMKV